MGHKQSKEKIRKILEEKNISNPNSNEQKNLKIEYKCNQEEGMNLETNSNNVNGKNSDYQDNKDSYNFSKDENQAILSAQQDIKNVKKFPYIAIGTVIVRTSNDEDLLYTCFLIGTNVVVTLASNLLDPIKGGLAKSIYTTFSEEKVKPENIKIQGEEKNGKKNENKKETNQTLENVNSSKLAVILYEDNIGNEWIGVEEGKQEDFSGKDINVIFTTGLKARNNTNNGNEDNEEKGENETKKGKNEPALREVNVNNVNPFKNPENSKEKDIIKKVPGSPIYYKGYISGGYVIAVVNESYEFQYFDHDTMVFLSNMVNQGKLLRKNYHKGIEVDNNEKLDLSKNDFGPLDIKYLTEFDLTNIRILDLSSNLIKKKGAFYLSQGKFSCLESLNLNFNEIGDEGLNHIANGFFNKLNYLYLFHNNISAEGIKFLVKAKFVYNLKILSLLENPKIGDTGVRIMKEHKEWSNLSTLNLNSAGLTDEALKYLGEASMPKLKKLNILGNKFTDVGKPSIDGLIMNHIQVCYRTQLDIDREREKKGNK